MKKRKHIRTVYFYILLTTVTLLTVSSCIFESDREESHSYQMNANSDIINIRKEEAKLLVTITELNLKVLTLTKVAKDKTSNSLVKSIASRIEEDHNAIKIELKDIAAKKLVSIPDTVFRYNIKNSDLKSLDENYLTNASKLISEEVDYFEKLSHKTFDPDFKILAIQTIVKLKTSLDAINKSRKLNIYSN